LNEHIAESVILSIWDTICVLALDLLAPSPDFKVAKIKPLDLNRLRALSEGFEVSVPFDYYLYFFPS